MILDTVYLSVRVIVLYNGTLWAVAILPSYNMCSL